LGKRSCPPSSDDLEHLESQRAPKRLKTASRPGLQQVSNMQNFQLDPIFNTQPINSIKHVKKNDNLKLDKQLYSVPSNNSDNLEFQSISKKLETKSEF